MPSRRTDVRVPSLPYRDRMLEGFLPDPILSEGRLIPLRTPAGVAEIDDVDRALLRALEVSSTPDLVPALQDWFTTRYRGGDITIIVDDYTRPCVHQRRLLPGLLQWLRTRGVTRERISVLIATATHRDPRAEEYPHMFGPEIWPAWRDRIFPHRDTADLESFGAMPDGTDVQLNGRAARSEAILSLSDLDYHYFAGVSGGPKHLVPGIAGRALTTADHLRMFSELGFAPNVDMGILEGNPVYEYKREAVRRILEALRSRGTFVYAIISVLNPRHGFVALQGGEILTLHRRLRGVLDKVYVAEVPRLADVVIISAAHLGLNVYQAGKAINAASRAVRPGGAVVCVAPCPDGFGNSEFRELMKIAAPILRESARRIGAGADPASEGTEAIDRALRAVQEAVMKDFQIGKQKPVDLLSQYRKTGWGNLWLLCDGLSAEDRGLLPFRYIEGGGDPAARLREWIEGHEEHSPSTYLIIDDPTLWVRVGGRS